MAETTKRRYGKEETRAAILRYLRTIRFSPTYTEIGEAVNLRSKESVHAYLKDMEAHGEVAFTDSRKPRVYVPAA